jgi:hypothetical protein
MSNAEKTSASQSKIHTRRKKIPVAVEKTSHVRV